MLRRIRDMIKIPALRRKLNSSDGQIAIILILVIAAALVFYAVSLNLGNFTLTRALVTIASNTSASALASDMASYGQSLSSTSLDGERKICAWTGVFAAIIAIVIIVIAIIVAIFTTGAGAAYLTTVPGILAIIGLVLAVVALALQLTVLQPGLTEAWNEIISETLSMRNQFTEQAIQGAFSKVVTDPVYVPDVNDADRDRVWVPPAAIGAPPFADTISRYGMYYSDRLRKIQSQVALAEISRFINALQELVYEGTAPVGEDTWGLFDPMNLDMCLGRAECHACCTPDQATLIIDGAATLMTDLRPASCANPHDDVYWAQQCEPASPYQVPPAGDGGIGEGYPFLYDYYFENPYNSFHSFREMLGIDDEHVDYYKDANDPNSTPAPRTSQFMHINDLPVPTAQDFRLEDATGFYAAPNPIQTDPLPGIFPFFYKLRDWGVDLSVVTADMEGGLLTGDLRQCHWCDPTLTTPPAPAAAVCPPCSGYPPHPHPGEIPQLSLPLDPANPLDGLIYNMTYQVDGMGNWQDVANDLLPQPTPPLAIDRVTIDIPGEIIAEDPADPTYTPCAQDSLYPFPIPNTGFWRRGGDRFCRGVAPYFLECPKCNGTEDCECSDPATDPADFPDDVLDDLIYSLPEFFEWALRTLTDASNLADFTEDFPNWYPEAAVWIEPLSPPGVSMVDCYVCDLALPDGMPVPEGILWIWLKEAREVRDRILHWLGNYSATSGNYEGYTGTTCSEVWCVPDPTLVCPEIPPGEGEDATFDANNDGVQGDVEDILHCLTYNANGYDHVAAEAFKNCLNNCNIANCTVGPGGALPQFRLDGVTPYEYPTVPAPPCGVPVPFSCVAPAWGPGNPWFDKLTENLADAVKSMVTMEGNDYRFRECAMSCSLEDCHRLPRSLVPFAWGPLYFPANYRPWDTVAGADMAPAIADGIWKDITAFNDCLTNCNPENCMVGPRLPTVHSSDGITPYVYPGGPIDCTAASGWGTYLGGNAWYDALIDNRTLIKPPDEVDMEPMLRCFDDCTANIADCQAMPVNQSSTVFPPLPPPPPPVPYPWPADPSTMGVADCTAPGWGTYGGGNAWYDAIVDSVLQAGGPSCDLNASGWLESTRQSAIEATNQVIKFAKRRDFLLWRWREATKIVNIFDGDDTNRDGWLDVMYGEDYDGDCLMDNGFIPALEYFLYAPNPLTGTPAPAQELINARIAYAPASGETGLPFHAIYGWRDEDEVLPGGINRRGKWHIVKVEARTPGMCDNLCSWSQGSPDPPWPRIITYTKNWGTKRCYELINTNGSVKFRTTRWDEDPSTKWCAGVPAAECPPECIAGGGCGPGSMATYRPALRFPNGVPIWTFRGNHPERPLRANPDLLDGFCAAALDDATIKTLPGTGVGTTIYLGAFMLNRFYPPGDPMDNHDCWNLAHHLLQSGVVNETCARYYWHEGSLPGMGLEFVPCQPF